MAICPNKNSKEWKDLVDEYGEGKAYLAWHKSNLNSDAVNGYAKVIGSLIDLSETKKTIRLSTKDKPNLTENFRKNLQNKGVPKSQIDLAIDYVNNYSEGSIKTTDLISGLLGQFGYTVETKVSKSRQGSYVEWMDDPEAEIDPGYYVIDEETDTPIRKATNTEIKFPKGQDNVPTQTYSDLSVPGGTNYREVDIRTPEIEPSLKSHARFATDQSIGWFRSDEKKSGIRGGEEIKEEDPFGREVTVDTTKEDTGSKTRRILEFQSDLFQKGRNREDLIFFKSTEKLKKLTSKEMKLQHTVAEIERKTKFKPLSWANMFGVTLDEFILDRILNHRSKQEIYKEASSQYPYTDFEDMNRLNSISREGIKEEMNSDEFDSVKTYIINKEIERADDSDLNEEYANELRKNLKALKKEKTKESKRQLEEIKKRGDNQFLQLLNKNNNWVNFFIESIIQDSAKKGYEKVLFPKGDTAAKVEGHETLEEFKKQKEDRIKKLKSQKNRDVYSVILKESVEPDRNNAWLRTFDTKQEAKDSISEEEASSLDIVKGDLSVVQEINQLRQELADVESGRTRLSSIANFYETTVGNILKKKYGDQAKEITDEHGNKWVEIPIKVEDTNKNIFFQKKKYGERKNEPNKELNDQLKSKFLSEHGISVEMHDNLVAEHGGDVRAVADLYNKAIKVATGRMKEDTLPEEVSHFAITMLRGTNYYNQMYDLATKSDMYNQVKEDYGELYDGDEARIIEETMAKLLSDQVVNKYKQSSVTSKMVRLLTKMWNKFKKMFTNANPNTIDGMIEEIYGEAAEKVLANESEFFNQQNLQSSKLSKMFQMSNKSEKILDKAKSVVEDAMTTIDKKIKKYNQEHKYSYTKKEEELLNKLQSYYDNGNTIDGIVTFVNNAHKDLVNISERVDNLRENMDKYSMREGAKILLNMRSYHNSYEPLFQEIENTIEDYIDNSEFSQEEKNKLSDLKEAINDSLSKIRRANDTFKEVGVPLFAKKLKQFAGNRGEYGYGTEFDKNLEDVIEQLEGDINIFDRFLRSFANTNNDIAQLIDKMVKNSKLNSRKRTRDTMKDLFAYKKELEAKGIDDARFVFEKDENGKPTGFIIGNRNKALFEKEKKKFYERIFGYGKNGYGIQEYLDRGYNVQQAFKKKYGNKEGQKNFRAYKKAKKKWFDENQEKREDAEEIKKQKLAAFKEQYGEVEGKRIYNHWLKENTIADSVTLEETFIGELAQPSKKYENKEYQKLNQDQKDFVEYIRNLKREHDRYLNPKFVNQDLLPQIRSDFVEKAQNADTLSELTGSIKDDMKRYLQRKEEDETAYGMLDEDGDVVNFVPIYYTTRLENPGRDMSTDIVAIMSMYSDMANNYKEMNSLVHMMELGTELLEPTRRGNQPFETDEKGRPRKDPSIGKFDEGDETTVSSVYNKAKSFIKKKNGSYLYDKLMDYKEMLVYGQFKKDEGPLPFFPKLDQANVVDAFNNYVSLNALAFNVYSGIANTTYGNAQTRIEAMAGQYFDNNDLTFADKNYWSHLSNRLGDVGVRQPISKMSAWEDYLDPLQDYEASVFGAEGDRKTRVSQLFKSSAFYFINHMGEHQMHIRTSLALAHRFKLLDKDGNQTNLWEAAYADKKGKLKFKEGTRKLDGSELTQEDINGFINKQNKINQDMHGIYNYLDRNPLQRHSLGRMALLFRKFIVPGFDKRWRGLRFNEINEDWEEGFYRTSGRVVKNFLGQLYGDLKRGQFSFTKNFPELQEWEKANFKRGLTEVAYLLASATLAGIANSMSGDEEDNWQMNMTAYQANRFYTELAFHVSLDEALTILKSPSAGVNQIQKISDLTKAIAPVGAITGEEDFFRKYESGRKEGQLYATKSLTNILPFLETVEEVRHPEEQLEFYSR